MDEFTRKILRVVIARFIVAKKIRPLLSQKMLDMFVDAIIFRIKEIAIFASEFTTRSHRIDTNGYDVFYALSNSKYKKESPETLYSFLNKSPFSSFPYLIEPYPLVQESEFYHSQKNITTFPFRSNTFLFKDQASKGNRIFLEYPNPTNPIGKDTKKTGEGGHMDWKSLNNQIKKGIQEVLSESNNTHNSTIKNLQELDDTIVKVSTAGPYSKPSKSILRPALIVCEKPQINPEMIPLIDQVNSSDQNALTILNAVKAEPKDSKNQDSKKKKND